MSTATARKHLGGVGASLSDEELEEEIRNLDHLAQLMIASYKVHNSSKAFAQKSLLGDTEEQKVQ